MGVDPSKKVERLLIGPRRTKYFVLTFSKDFFGILKGEHLRMSMNTWKNSQLIGDRESMVVLKSPVFDCP
jgi:hypothetical protein